MSKRPPPVSPTIVCTAYGPTRRKDERVGTRSAGDAFGAADAAGLTFRCTTRVRLSNSWTPVQPLPRRAVENSRMVRSCDSKTPGVDPLVTPMKKMMLGTWNTAVRRPTRSHHRALLSDGSGCHAQAHEPLAQRGAPAAFQDEEVDHRREPRPRRESDQQGRGFERHADRPRRGHEQPDHDRDDCPVSDPRDEACPERSRDFIRGPVRPQEIRQLGVRLRPSGGSLRKAAQHDGCESARNVTPKHTWRQRLLGGDLRDELTIVRRVERRPSRQEVVERRADGVDVGADVERLASQLLRRRELRRALEAGRRELVPHVACQRGDGESEVTNLDGAVRVDEAIRRLDVAVENSRCLRRVEAADDVEHGRYGGGWRTSAPRPRRDPSACRRRATPS